MADTSPSPLQNRVTPFGEIVAVAQRGTFTGNRGILHDPTTKTLLGRRWASKAWLVCTCAYKDRRRNVMGSRSWTELFFLDEAVALAAGHRPCFFCRREAAEQFREAWTVGNGGPQHPAAAMDAILHTERLEHGRKRLHAVPDRIDRLPSGTMIVAKGSAFTLHAGLAWRWTETGYAAPEQPSRADGLLTPPSTLAALASGYQPVLHPSIAWGETRDG